MSKESNRPLRDFVPRGDPGSTPVGTTLFTIFRLADIPLQYSLLSGILSPRIFATLGINVPNTFPASGLLDLPLNRLIILSMPAWLAVKQVYWAHFLMHDRLPVSSVLGVSVANWVVNSSFTLFSLYLTDFSDQVTPTLLIGSAIFTIGSLAELVSEIQRERFKSDPKNKGKPYTGGLFKLARHINLGGYALLRGGHGLAAGGWWLGAVILALFTGDFATRAVPIVDQYCEKKA